MKGAFRKNAHKGMDAPHRKIMVLHVGLSKFVGFVTQGDLKATVSK